jgi:hypothetical protein
MHDLSSGEASHLPVQVRMIPKQVWISLRRYQIKSQPRAVTDKRTGVQVERPHVIQEFSINLTTENEEL